LSNGISGARANPTIRIFLVGHSWGTYLGAILVHRHPELFYAYISVGQVVDGDASLVIVRKFLQSEAERAKDTALLRKLAKGPSRRLKMPFFAMAAN
jgi:pimeloyl-ACP methyl ester carboxylesterase